MRATQPPAPADGDRYTTALMSLQPPYQAALGLMLVRCGNPCPQARMTGLAMAAAAAVSVVVALA